MLSLTFSVLTRSLCGVSASRCAFPAGGRFRRRGERCLISAFEIKTRPGSRMRSISDIAGSCLADDNRQLFHLYCSCTRRERKKINPAWPGGIGRVPGDSFQFFWSEELGFYRISNPSVFRKKRAGGSALTASERD